LRAAAAAASHRPRPRNPGPTHGLAWAAPIIGIWTIITPWVIRGGAITTTATIANNVAVGAVAVAVGAAAVSIATRSKH
jgi:hypothetical protein